MSSKKTKTPLSKRQALREKHLQRERQTRLIIIGSTIGVVLLIIILLVIPQIQEANPDTGDIVRITPYPKPLAKGREMGDEKAKAKIEVFEDFKCSACQSYSQNIEPLVIKELVETGKAYYIFRHNPFEDDNSAIKESDQAANASMCAAAQNRFWDFKEITFANLNFITGEFRDSRLLAFAEVLGLDMGAFKKCFEEKRYWDQIQEDINLAEQMGVTGTPTVFVNGQVVMPGYVPSFEQIKEAVEKASQQ